MRRRPGLSAKRLAPLSQREQLEPSRDDAEPPRAPEPEPASINLASMLSAMGIDDESAIAPEPMIVDGIEMPVELSELRALLELRAKLQVDEAGARARIAALERSASRETELELASVRREVSALGLKASIIDDCMIDFGESFLFLHELALDHEELLVKLRAARSNAAVFPKGFGRYDEAVDAPEDDELFDDDFGEPYAIPTLRADGRNDPGDRALQQEEPVGTAEDDYEALDQRRQASLAQLRACLRSCGIAAVSSARPLENSASNAGTVPSSRLRSKLGLTGSERPVSPGGAR